MRRCGAEAKVGFRGPQLRDRSGRRQRLFGGCLYLCFGTVGSWVVGRVAQQYRQPLMVLFKESQGPQCFCTSCSRRSLCKFPCCQSMLVDGDRGIRALSCDRRSSSMIVRLDGDQWKSTFFSAS